MLEAIDALDGSTDDGYEHLEEELGDLLFQVCSTRRSPPRRASSRWPTWRAAIHDKLVRRHPHVFGDVEADSADAGARQLGADQEGREGPRRA